MSRPIKETPVLTGKDAERFYINMKKAETQKASPEELQKIKESYERIKAISSF